MQLRLVSRILDAATTGSYDWQTDSLTHSDCLTGLARYLAVLMGPDETIHVAVLGGITLFRRQFQGGGKTIEVALSGGSEIIRYFAVGAGDYSGGSSLI